MSEQRLRIAHVIVQPVLVWDDGEELAPGPACNPLTVPLSLLDRMPEQLRAELPKIEQQHRTAQEQADDSAG